MLRSLGALLALAFVSGAVPVFADNYTIGTYYFGVWSEQECNVCADGYGCDEEPPPPPSPPPPPRWWCGPWQYVENETSNIPPEAPWYNYPPGAFAHFEPAIGFYDNSLETTMETHIKQARANGIDYFNFYWMWDENANGGNGGELFGYVDTFLATPTTYDLRFTVSVVTLGFPIPESQWASVIDTLITKFPSQPHILRTPYPPPSGQPIISFLGLGFGSGSQTDAAAFLSQFRAATVSALGVHPFIVADIRQNGSGPASDPIDLEALDDVNSYTCLAYYDLARTDDDPLVNCPDDPPVGSHVQYNPLIVNELTSWAYKPSQRPVIPCYMAAFDERARTESHVWVDWCEWRYLTDWSLATLHDGMQGIKTFVDTVVAPTVPRHVNIYAWNEWREAGHNLEPNAAEGNAVLAEIADVFDLDTFGDELCKEFGDCPESYAMPEGNLEVANCEMIGGWARDPDTSLPATVLIFKGPYGPGNPDPVAVTVANLYRDDPGWPFLGRYHGFALPTPPEFCTGQEEWVNAYIQDVGVNGNPTGPTTQLIAIPITCFLFRDGFETGDTAAWSSTSP